MRINIVEQGASIDGCTLVTEIVKKAIETLKEAGGGELYFPAGKYRCGAIELCDNLTLRLERGALLSASEDISDFFFDDRVPPEWLPYYFIHAHGCKNVCICGDGIIDGNGRAYWLDSCIDERRGNNCPEVEPPYGYCVLKPKSARPVLVYIAGSSNVTITGITILNSPSYTIWTNNCENVVIDNVVIRNSRKGPNTDALDIDCCEHVRITNCDIDAGDDCIAIKSDPNRENAIHPSRNIEVAHCRLSTATCAIRIGYEGDAPICQCRFHDLEMINCHHGIDMLSITPCCKLKIDHGTPIDDLLFEDIVMTNVAQAFFVWAGNEGNRTDYSAHISGITFRNLKIESLCTSYIGGNSPQNISGIVFENVNLHVADVPEVLLTNEPDTTIPCHWGGHEKSGGLRFHGVEPAVWKNVSVTCDQPGLPAVVKIKVSK